MEEILDGHMITNSRALFSLIVVELAEEHFDETLVILDSYLNVLRGDDQLESPERVYEAYESDFNLQLTHPSGTSIFSSTDRLLIDTVEARTGFFQITQDGLKWHVLGLKDSRSGYTLYTAQSDKVRKEFSLEAIKYMFMPLTIGMVSILISVWIAIQFGLRPLNKLGDELDRRDLNSLKPLDESHDLEELLPVVSSLNRLFRRMSTMLENEKQFSADVSHELRTPLARIMASSDALESTTVDSIQLRLIHNINASSMHAKELTNDLLLLSKIGQGNAHNYFESEQFNILQLVNLEMSELEMQYQSNQEVFDFTCSGNASSILKGSASLFSTLIRNIFINAVVHGEQKTPIEVHVDCAEIITITVRDYGPGVPVENLPDLFERFYRGRSGNPSSTGLGLAIVKDIANYFSATVTAANASPQGLLVVLTFSRESRINSF